MPDTDASAILLARHPFALLSADGAEMVRRAAVERAYSAGDTVAAAGEPLDGLLALVSGEIDLTDRDASILARLGPGDLFGGRELLEGGTSSLRAVAASAARAILLPAADFATILVREPAFAAHFARRGAPRRTDPAGDLALVPVAEIMTRDPVSVTPATPVAEAAALMDRMGISCLLVVEDGRLAGIVTTGDLVGRILARGRPGSLPVSEAMTAAPRTVGPGALGHDVFLAMVRHGIGHFPVVEDGRPLGILTRTNLLARQARSPGLVVAEIARAARAADLPPLVAGIPALLAQLVAAGARPETVTRLVTDIADAATRRLVDLALAELGPPPVPFLWLACGSQGRQEQTGVSDQDNCLILHDDARAEHEGWFAALARRVSDGLEACGYAFCPGDMMATNPRWRQPVRVWRDYFAGWIRKPDPMAQMLASVMFDLRPIAGDETLFRDLQAETLAGARANSIFVAHMVSNALKHAPPLSLWGGIATIRSGEHKDTLDLKHSGVVPVVDLGRIYAIQGAIAAASTRARIEAAREGRVISESGARDLLDAYDLIAAMRLEHQAAQVRAGAKPDNFMHPARLSDLERGYLREAFQVIRTMQSALSQGRHTV